MKVIERLRRKLGLTKKTEETAPAKDETSKGGRSKDLSKAQSRGGPHGQSHGESQSQAPGETRKPKGATQNLDMKLVALHVARTEGRISSKKRR